MGLVFGIALYFIIWWLVLFAVMPFFTHTQAEAGGVVHGTPASAPEKPRLLRIALVTTIAACLAFAFVYACLEVPALRTAVGGFFGY